MYNKIICIPTVLIMGMYNVMYTFYEGNQERPGEYVAIKLWNKNNSMSLVTVLHYIVNG